MHGVEPLGIGPRQGYPPHGTDVEPGIFDSLDDSADEPSLDGIRFDDGQRALRHPAIISAPSGPF